MNNQREFANLRAAVALGAFGEGTVFIRIKKEIMPCFIESFIRSSCHCLFQSVIACPIHTKHDVSACTSGYPL